MQLEQQQYHAYGVALHAMVLLISTTLVLEGEPNFQTTEAGIL